MTDSQRFIEVIEDPAFIEAQRKHRTTLERERNAAAQHTFRVAIGTSLGAGAGIVSLIFPQWSDLAFTSDCFLRVAFGLGLGAIGAGSALTWWCHGDRYERSCRDHNRWRGETKHYFCPECRFHLPSTVPWTCPRCSHINSGDNEYSYLAECRNCGKPVDAILCQRCKRAIKLDTEGPIRSIAVIAGRHPSSATDE